MIRRPPRSTRTDTLFPYTTLFRSESWTPARIIIAGLATGFLAGRADPARVLKQLGSGGRWIQLVGALSGLAASLQSSIAAADAGKAVDRADDGDESGRRRRMRSEEHTSELQSLMRISYAVFCLKKKNRSTNTKGTNDSREMPEN